MKFGEGRLAMAFCSASESVSYAAGVASPDEEDVVLAEGDVLFADDLFDVGEGDGG
jgi:hypothetical protein